MLKTYHQHSNERQIQGIPPLPLDAEQTHSLTLLLENPGKTTNKEFLLDLLKNRIPPGVDKASYVKANWLNSIAEEKIFSPLIKPKEATRLLGTMMGGYNVSALIEIIQGANHDLANIAAESLSNTLLIYDALNDVIELAKTNPFAKKIIESWASMILSSSRTMVNARLI